MECLFETSGSFYCTWPKETTSFDEEFISNISCYSLYPTGQAIGKYTYNM